MINRFWFYIYNFVALPILFVLIKYFASRKPNLQESLEKREGLWERLESIVAARNWEKPLIWFHVASAGEYLQAQPVVKRCIEEGAECILTYSSINACRWLERTKSNEMSGLLGTEFLPIDTLWNARRLLGLMQVSRLVWVSYDLWPNLVWEAHTQKIPQTLISGIIHEESSRNSNPIGRSFYRTIYSCLDHLLMVSESDRQRILRATPSHAHVEVMGDTRCDSVLERRDQLEINELPALAKDATVLVVGSSWPADEAIIFNGLKNALNKFPALFLIIAPHEPTKEQLENTEQYFSNQSISRWSNLTEKDSHSRILLVDTIGILAGLYRSAHIAYIGGGFTTGVHNILEPIAMGATVSFGPKNHNSMEALQMLHQGLATSISTPDQFQTWLFDLLDNTEKTQILCEQSKNFVEQQAGATQLCLPKILSNL